MIRVVILGSGNVATHLTKAFLNTQTIEVVQVYGRSKNSLKHIVDLVATTTNLTELTPADVYIIAIADDAIALFSSQLPNKDALVVHTSGSVAMNAIDNRFRQGVFYPLQTFTKNSTVDFSVIPICLEAQHNKDLVLLEKLGSAISNAVYFIDSKQRESLHVAAVFANNFTNHLYYIAKTICAENKVPFAVLRPLIQETANKIKTIDPIKAQTGPAKRNDQKTIAKHLNQLPEAYQNIYKTLTTAITKTYEQEL